MIDEQRINDIEQRAKMDVLVYQQISAQHGQSKPNNSLLDRSYLIQLCRETAAKIRELEGAMEDLAKVNYELGGKNTDLKKWLDQLRDGIRELEEKILDLEDEITSLYEDMAGEDI